MECHETGLREPRRTSRLWVRGVRVIVTAIAGFLAISGGLLFFLQRSLMYMPRAYEPSYRLSLPDGAREITFQTTEGDQVAFYIPPLEGADAVPDVVWICFHGNGATALDWVDAPFVRNRPSEGTAFLLVDYPGYGVSQGRPTRAGIQRNAVGATEALQADLGLSDADMGARLGVIGFSMGAAAAMELAAARPVPRIVLLAPFTSIMDMAGRMYGPFKYLALDRFDNAERLREVAGRGGATVHIFHGRSDDIIPFPMAEKLAAVIPGTTLHRIELANHNNLIDVARDELGRVLESMSGSGDRVEE